MIQVPILLSISELILVQKKVSSYEVAYAICFIQFITILLYFRGKGWPIFDVPQESRSLLIARSLIYCAGFLMFMKSMEFLNPVVALIAHQTGLFAATTLIRLFYREGRECFFVVVCLKFSVTALILLQGWITYETLPIHEEDLEKKQNQNWDYYYQLSIALGLGSGTMLAIASRISNVLCKPGALYHEAYITLYAQGISVCIIPLFIVTNAKRLSHLDKWGDIETESSTLLMRVSTYAFLFVIIFVKVFALERGIMSRFVEEYDDEKHSLTKWIGRCFGQGEEQEESRDIAALNLDRSGSPRSDGEDDNHLEIPDFS